MEKKKKFNAVGLLYKLCVSSVLGIVGIIGWCNISLDMGGKGMTSTLLFVIFVLLLVACNAVIIASDEDMRREYEQTKKLYILVKNDIGIKKNALFEHGQPSIKFWTIALSTFTFGVVCAIVIHASFVKSVIMSAFICIAITYIIIAIVVFGCNMHYKHKFTELKKRLERIVQ